MISILLQFTSGAGFLKNISGKSLSCKIEAIHSSEKIFIMLLWRKFDDWISRELKKFFKGMDGGKNIDMVWCFNFQYSWEMNSKCCNIRVQVVDRFSVVGGWNVENISLFRHLYKDRCLNDQIWSYNLLWLHTLVVYHGKAHIKSFWGLTS